MWIVVKKSEIIEFLLKYNYDYDELKKQKKEELEELFEEHTSTSDVFPNGRDVDSEDEDI